MTQQDRPDNVTVDAQQDEAADERFDESGAPDAGTPEARLAEAEAEAAELKDQLLRAAAELENVRRRAARDVENAHRYGIERFARDLLDVADSVELGLDAARQAEGEQAAPEAEPNTVIAVVQPGWRIHDRLLRPARVIVARHPEPGQP
jgi:molecular chaperone GrpE